MFDFIEMIELNKQWLRGDWLAALLKYLQWWVDTNTSRYQRSLLHLFWLITLPWLGFNPMHVREMHIAFDFKREFTLDYHRVYTEFEFLKHGENRI